MYLNKINNMELLIIYYLEKKKIIILIELLINFNLIIIQNNI